MSTDVIVRSEQREMIPALLVGAAAWTRTATSFPSLVASWPPAPTFRRYKRRTPTYQIGSYVSRREKIHVDPFAVSQVAAYVAFEVNWQRKPSATLITACEGTTWTVFVGKVEPSRGIDAALTRFAERVAGLPQVVGVSHAVEGTIHRVWTFIVRRDKAIRRKVYLEEHQLMEEFPAFQFDFNVVDLEALPARGLIPDDLQGRIIFFREDRALRPFTDA